jgi:site-specific DNA-methyltransferase (adenine-specific)
MTICSCCGKPRRPLNLSGLGTALKPAMDLICLARKPLIGTVAENVLEHGTGALNIDGCRVGTDENLNGGRYSDDKKGDDGNTYGSGINLRSKDDYKQPLGRWPANVIHDGSDEVVEAFPETSTHGRSGAEYANGTFSSGAVQKEIDKDSGSAARFFKSCNGRDGEASADRRYVDETGFAMLPGARRDGVPPARFFYTAKAGADDRLGSKHPTVKPLDLMQYLCRLVTPKGGTVLDPFAGTGTTGEAAFREGFNAVLIERETEYQADIRRRMSLVLGGPEERRNASLKAKGLVEDAGPLFGGL